ncbi:helix-turn-helix domain-containing protein [Streptomyces cocklensis]|uniref:IclR family transcriptional regulator n=1 Tax=Actinacidiphila cocklensis TaxID=887465 RepID=A0A9W4DPG9_9ACTN|nr:IclR family transcriptional regulator C-terminal domain-containing protein [Actinacidiphila cocklensis]MDD1064088.1 helix-turn-helix domain-containing protein [Actinacidiphila cocklensis]WSX75714.1 helix-turn-helix domain-containing protein [Streptomyces sp. NBC_00899]CAG6395228.1 IclR family transcriptional regulator [Actinacidiphila cocklensis]
MTPIRRRAGNDDASFSGQQPGAVQKALSMLEAVAHLGPGTSARDIAAFAGVPSATAYRMLNLLVADGYLVRMPDLSGFALGRRTAELAYAANGSAPSSSVHKVAEDLRRHTRFGLHIASFADGRLRFVDQDPDHDAVGIALLRHFLHANALGKLLLAHHPRLRPASALPAVTEHTIRDHGVLDRELDHVLQTGYAYEDQEALVGRAALAVPIRDETAHVVGGLYLHGAARRITPDDGGLLRFALDGASRLTGRL